MNDPKCIRIQSKGTVIKCLNEAIIQTMLNNANNFNILINDLSCFSIHISGHTVGSGNGPKGILY